MYRFLSLCPENLFGLHNNSDFADSDYVEYTVFIFKKGDFFPKMADSYPYSNLFVNFFLHPYKYKYFLFWGWECQFISSLSTGYFFEEIYLTKVGVIFSGKIFFIFHWTYVGWIVRSSRWSKPPAGGDTDRHLCPPVTAKYTFTKYSGTFIFAVNFDPNSVFIVQSAPLNCKSDNWLIRFNEHKARNFLIYNATFIWILL